MDFFAKIKSLANKMIRVRILGLLSDKAYEFDDLLKNIDFTQELNGIKEIWSHKWQPQCQNRRSYQAKKSTRTQIE